MLQTDIDVCAIEEAWGGCDLNAPRYRVPDTLSAEERVTILTAIAKAALRSPVIYQTAARAGAVTRPSGVIAASRAIQAGGSMAAESAQQILTFVQRDAGYRDDPEGEWYQGPLYTLKHGGDCEDLAVLFVALAASQGLRARIQWLDQPQHRLNHVTAEVFLDGRWQWAEPSILGARIGENPYDAVARVGQAKNLGVRERSDASS